MAQILAIFLGKEVAGEIMMDADSEEEVDESEERRSGQLFY